MLLIANGRSFGRAWNGVGVFEEVSADAVEEGGLGQDAGSGAGQEENAVEKGPLPSGSHSVPGKFFGVDGKLAGLDQGLDRWDNPGHIGQVGRTVEFPDFSGIGPSAVFE
jgi:hypothetical protein